MENNIEEAIKIMEHWIEYEKNNKEKINRADELINIQETILSAYKRVLKEKNRLEEQVEYDKTHIYTPQTIKLNFISKSKIKDKIEQLKEKEESDLRCYGFAVDTHLALQTLQELLDGNDTNVGSIGNSIEEDITKINTYVELVLKKDYCNCNELNTILGKHCDGSKNVAYAMQHILSAYRRVLKENEKLRVKWDKDTHILQNKLDYANADRIDLAQQNKELRKENEELKQDRNNNYQMIALAQNEALGYMQGYEDGKKLKRSAVANIVENQQYYIIKKQIEKYETYIEQLRKELEQKDKIIDLIAETINNYDIDEDVCKQMGQKANCNEYEDAKECKECIKQYFINKAKEIR